MYMLLTLEQAETQRVAAVAKEEDLLCKVRRGCVCRGAYICVSRRGVGVVALFVSLRKEMYATGKRQGSDYQQSPVCVGMCGCAHRV